MYLKFQLHFNTDERAAIDSAIANNRVLSLLLDGIFFRAEETSNAPRTQVKDVDDDLIVIPMAFPNSTPKLRKVR